MCLNTVLNLHRDLHVLMLTLQTPTAVPVDMLETQLDRYGAVLYSSPRWSPSTSHVFYLLQKSRLAMQICGFVCCSPFLIGHLIAPTISQTHLADTRSRNGETNGKGFQMAVFSAIGTCIMMGRGPIDNGNIAAHCRQARPVQLLHISTSQISGFARDRLGVYD